MGYVSGRINYSKCNNKCENIKTLFIPIVKPSINNVKVMKNAQKIRHAFGIARGRYHPKKNIVSVSLNAYGQKNGAPNGSGKPPRNF